MDSPGSEGFHAQLDCKLTDGDKKSNTANSCIVSIVSCSKAKEKIRNYEKYSQTGVTVKIHTNYDGIESTTIMLSSNTASSSWRFPVIAVKQASENTSAALRMNK